MNIILQNLMKLQALEFGEVAAKNVEAQGAELRGKIPPPITAHYDRLRLRGKKGIVFVRHQVCTGCHMHVPIGQITMLMRDEDVQLCENCGRYLCLPDPAEAEAAAPVEAAKPAAKVAKVTAKVAKVAVKAAAKPRKRRALAHAA
jgi:Fe-S-cluster-containing dehydrogenase component